MPRTTKKANKMLPSLGNEIKATILYVFKAHIIVTLAHLGSMGDLKKQNIRSLSPTYLKPVLEERLDIRSD